MASAGSANPAAGNGMVRSPAAADRVGCATDMLHVCNMCEWRCGVDRFTSAKGPCRLSADTYLYKAYPSLNEEPELSPALRIFLSGCNFRCPWCDEAPEAMLPTAGQRVDAQTLAKCFASDTTGLRAISILGGEPTLHTHTLLAAVAERAPSLPLALNSNMYMTEAVLDLLAGVVQWYLADFKFGNDDCALKLAGVPRYLEVVTRNLVRAARDADVIVRHVLLPGHLDCCFRAVADTVADLLPGVRFELYPAYVPCGVGPEHPGLRRMNTPEEIQAAREHLAGLGLEWATEHSARACRHAAEAAGGHGVISVTLGADGRVYCPDLTPQLATLLGEALGNEADPPTEPVPIRRQIGTP